MGSIFFQLDPAAEKEHIKKKNEADMKREAEVEKKTLNNYLDPGSSSFLRPTWLFQFGNFPFCLRKYELISIIGNQKAN